MDASPFARARQWNHRQMARKRQARRCSASNRRGLPCGNYAVLGAVVCRMHGGAAPQVRSAARNALNDDLAARMLRSLRSDGGLMTDGRIGPRSPGAYGCLPPDRRELFLAERRRMEIDRDPLLSALRDCVIPLTPLGRLARASRYGWPEDSPAPRLGQELANV